MQRCRFLSRRSVLRDVETESSRVYRAVWLGQLGKQLANEVKTPVYVADSRSANSPKLLIDAKSPVHMPRFPNPS